MRSHVDSPFTRVIINVEGGLEFAQQLVPAAERRHKRARDTEKTKVSKRALSTEFRDDGHSAVACAYKVYELASIDTY